MEYQNLQIDNAQYIEHYQSEDFDIPLDDIITDKKI